MDKQNISKPTLRRLPVYLNYLKSLPGETRTISATAVAAALGLNEVQVRKDLSAASRNGGKPKMGYNVAQLVQDLEEFLGYHSTKSAVLIGVGRLGGALLSFTGFAECGMRRRSTMIPTRSAHPSAAFPFTTSVSWARSVGSRASSSAS